MIFFNFIKFTIDSSSKYINVIRNIIMLIVATSVRATEV